jgi:hypothetical protein
MSALCWVGRLRAGYWGDSTVAPPPTPPDPPDPPTVNALVSLGVRPTTEIIDPTSGKTWTVGVVRSGNTGVACSISWEATPFGVIAGDYAVSQVFSGTIAFASGETSKTITFSALGTRGIDGSLTFALETPSNCELTGPVSTVITLLREPVGGVVHGITFDDPWNTAPTVEALSALPVKMTARIVFDEGQSAASYGTIPAQIHAVAFTMGELLDSESVPNLTVLEYTNRATEFLTAFSSHIDIWEIGNEVNGDWLGSTSDVVDKIAGAFDIIKAAGKKTALTGYLFSPAPSGHEMISWLTTNIPDRMKTGLDYVLVSYYEVDNPGPAPNWTSIFNSLGAIFPNSLLGVGECGTEVAADKAALMTQYYRMTADHPRFIGGFFWWYGSQDIVPKTKPLWSTLSTLLAGTPPPEPPPGPTPEPPPPEPPSSTWPAVPTMLTSGSNRKAVGTGTELQNAINAAAAGHQITLTADITTSLVLTYDATGTQESPVVLRGDNDSTNPANWRELTNATLRLQGDRVIVTKLRLNNVKIFFGNANETSERYNLQRVTRCVMTGGTGSGRRDAAVTLNAGCRRVRVDHCQIGAYGSTAFARHGFLGDQVQVATNLIEDILPVGTNPRNAWPGPARPGSIPTPSQNLYSQDVEVDHNLISDISRTTLGDNGCYPMFTGQDNGESDLPTRWYVHHNLFRNLLGADRPYIENKNSYTTVSFNTFERTSSSYAVGHLRFRHGDHNTAEGNLFVARGTFRAGNLQVRDQVNTIINNHSLKTSNNALVQGDDEITFYAGGLDAIFWPTRTGQSTSDNSFQINSIGCLCGGNKMAVRYGEWNTGTEAQYGVPCRNHAIGAGSGTGASRNLNVAAASGATSANYSNLNLTATVTGANWSLAFHTPLTTSNVGVAAP